MTSRSTTRRCRDGSPASNGHSGGSGGDGVGVRFQPAALPPPPLLARLILTRTRAEREQLAADIANDLGNAFGEHMQVPHPNGANPDPGDDPLPTSWSDAHVGETFGETLIGRWLYCRALGGWLRLADGRWLADPGEAVHEEFRQWIIRIGAQVWQTGGGSEEMKKVARYRERSKMDAAVTIARRLGPIAARVDEFDQHPYLLNCRNGVVDLRDGSISPHDPARCLVDA